MKDPKPKPEPCYHKLKRISEPPYRYICEICGKKLKIASGWVGPK
jgi:hypothetical protein